MKTKCLHLRVDDWHVPTPEAREIVRTRDAGRYGWRDQVRAELRGEVSRWMWPGLLALLAVGVVLGDWLLILGATTALLFFLFQAIAVVRALGASHVRTARARQVYRADRDDPDAEDEWRARLDQRPADVVVMCPECIAALRDGVELELAVILDPDDEDNSWLVGWRRAPER